jgi:Tfp pilus assembly protein PilW
MDEEIKISVSKKDLTYCAISVFLIAVGVWVGYRIGVHTTHENQPHSSGDPLFTPSTYTPAHIPIYTDPATVQQGAGDTPISGAHPVIQSDTSWEAKAPVETATPATVATYRYYSDETPTSSAQNTNTSEQARPGEGEQKYVASKNGTKYYPVHCKSANRINEENKVYFSTPKEAELEGLTAASTC